MLASKQHLRGRQRAGLAGTSSLGCAHPHLRVTCQSSSAAAATVLEGAGFSAAIGAGAPAQPGTSTTIKVLYRTEWEKALIHASVAGSPWKDFELTKQATPGKEKWLMGIITVPSGGPSKAPLLEFVVTNGSGQWDTSPDGNYKITEPGVYSLRDGKLNNITGAAVVVNRYVREQQAKARVDAIPENGSSFGPNAIRVNYRSSWDKAVLHGSLAGSKWMDFELTKQANPLMDKWLSGTVTVPADIPQKEGALLEFVVASGDKSQWDKPAAGGNYTIQKPGVYSVRNGQVNNITGPAILVVSDLDGTMVGDDAATGAFKAWWEEVGALRGGRLVYNTGRSLESFEQLARDKAHCLARPDALISAVGTKIYTRDISSGKWIEDKEWSALLDERWSLDAARDAAYQLLTRVGKDAMHFRPAEEQNNHKVTCGVRDDVAKQVVDGLQSCLEAAGMMANVISSGHGGWKYVDIVPMRAGKLQALEYVRRAAGFSLTSTVSCGDSGNDILMLSGENLSIVVGNAQPDLRAWVSARQSIEQPLPNGKMRLLQVKKPEASGILEGLEYYGLK